MNTYTELSALSPPERLTLARFSRRGALTRLRTAIARPIPNLAELDGADRAVAIIDDIIKHQGKLA